MVINYQPARETLFFREFCKLHNRKLESNEMSFLRDGKYVLLFFVIRLSKELNQILWPDAGEEIVVKNKL
jgi:hypothetical protein